MREREKRETGEKERGETGEREAMERMKLKSERLRKKGVIN